MPSRKRAKGRERKLKQQAREPVERSVSHPPLSPNGENINLPEQRIRRIEQAENIRCLHGGFKLPRGHPVSVIVDSFIKTMKNSKVSVRESLQMTLDKHKEVWKYETTKKMVIDRMLSIGTDAIIDKCIMVAFKISEAIIFLELCLCCKDTYHSAMSKATEDLIYIRSAEEREIVRFYKKRIPCSCLDELYSEIKKSQDRCGICYHCKQTIKRKYLKTCSRCECAQYCSKECQVLDWPSHKEDCMNVSRFHEVEEKAEAARSNEGII